MCVIGSSCYPDKYLTSVELMFKFSLVFVRGKTEMRLQCVCCASFFMFNKWIKPFLNISLSAETASDCAQMKYCMQRQWKETFIWNDEKMQFERKMWMYKDTMKGERNAGFHVSGKLLIQSETELPHKHTHSTVTLTHTHTHTHTVDISVAS